jgi:hypothetical protein
MHSLSLQPDDSLTIPKMALLMGSNQLVSLLTAIQANGFWLLPMQDYLLLNTPAFLDAQRPFHLSHSSIKTNMKNGIIPHSL